jgi:hypothetical protein
MSIQDEESTGKDEGEVKSTPSINQEVAPPLFLLSTEFLVLTRKVQSFYIFCSVCFVSFFDDN